VVLGAVVAVAQEVRHYRRWYFATTLTDPSPKSVGKNEFGQYVVTASDSGGSTYTVTFVVRGGVIQVISREHTLPTDN
jgi:hypothetical protein